MICMYILYGLLEFCFILNFIFVEIMDVVYIDFFSDYNNRIRFLVFNND